MTAALPAVTPSTRAEGHRTFRHWLIAADREQRYQAGMLTERREIGSGPVIALGDGRVRQLTLWEVRL